MMSCLWPAPWRRGTLSLRDSWLDPTGLVVCCSNAPPLGGFPEPPGQTPAWDVLGRTLPSAGCQSRLANFPSNRASGRCSPSGCLQLLSLTPPPQHCSSPACQVRQPAAASLPARGRAPHPARLVVGAAGRAPCRRGEEGVSLFLGMGKWRSALQQEQVWGAGGEPSCWQLGVGQAEARSWFGAGGGQGQRVGGCRPEREERAGPWWGMREPVKAATFCRGSEGSKGPSGKRLSSGVSVPSQQHNTTRHSTTAKSALGSPPPPRPGLPVSACICAREEEAEVLVCSIPSPGLPASLPAQLAVCQPPLLSCRGAA